MAITIIVVVVLVIGFFLWKSASSNKKVSDEQGTNNPNPNAPTSSRKV